MPEAMTLDRARSRTVYPIGAAVTQGIIDEIEALAPGAFELPARIRIVA